MHELVWGASTKTHQKMQRMRTAMSTHALTLTLLKTPIFKPNFPPFLQNPNPNHPIRRRFSLSASAATPPPITATPNVEIDPRYLSCCMPDKRLNVAVLVSGGVDSSVALRLLHAAGHSCTAFYLKIWFQVYIKRSGLENFIYSSRLKIYYFYSNWLVIYRGCIV